jgi:2-C-methyl-D-erythritol 4-phosphate cytidylyltransferase
LQPVPPNRDIKRRAKEGRWLPSWRRSETKAAALPQASKQSACLAVLERSEGATIRELQELTNWQEHSVRAFLAGTVKKRLGLDIASAKEERGRVYRIASRQRGR